MLTPPRSVAQFWFTFAIKKFDWNAWEVEQAQMDSKAVSGGGSDDTVPNKEALEQEKFQEYGVRPLCSEDHDLEHGDPRLHPWGLSNEVQAEDAHSMSSAQGAYRTLVPSTSSSEPHDEADGYSGGTGTKRYKTLPAFGNYGVLGRHEPEHPKGERIYLEWAEGEPTNPFNWSKKKKWGTTFLTSFFTVLAAYSAGAYPSLIDGGIAAFGHSREVWLLGLTMFTVGFGIAPMALGPLSELFGRSTIYFVTISFYLCFSVLCAAAPNITALLLGRFFAGLGAATGSTLVGGSISDIFHPNERGIPMAYFAWSALFATGLGAVVSGYTSSSTVLPGGPAYAWRWVTWLQVIVCACYAIVLVIFLPETRGSALLSRRAKKLREELHDYRIWAPSDDERASFDVMLKISMTRPFYLLICEPVVTSLSLWVSFAWGLLYLFLEAIPLVYENNHHFGAGSTGLVFLSLIVGCTIGFALNPLQDRWYNADARKHNGRARPEARLYLSMAGGIVFAIGLFIFGWTSFPNVHWIAPAIGVTVALVGLYQIYLTVFLILADAYGPYASSALAAQGFARNMFGAAFPLFALPLYNNLGYQWATTLLACIALILAIVPFVIYFYGPAIRARSKFSGQLMREEKEAEERRKLALGLQSQKNTENSTNADDTHV